MKINKPVILRHEGTLFTKFDEIRRKLKKIDEKSRIYEQDMTHFATENSRCNFCKIRGQHRCFAQKSRPYYRNRLSARRSIAGRADAAFDVLAIVVAHHFNYELKSRKSVDFWSTFPIYKKGFPIYKKGFPIYKKGFTFITNTSPL